MDDEPSSGEVRGDAGSGVTGPAAAPAAAPAYYAALEAHLALHPEDEE